MPVRFPLILSVHHDHSLHTTSDISYQEVTIKDPETSEQDEQLCIKCCISLRIANRLTEIICPFLHLS